MPENEREEQGSWLSSAEVVVTTVILTLLGILAAVIVPATLRGRENARMIQRTAWFQQLGHSVQFRLDSQLELPSSILVLALDDDLGIEESVRDLIAPDGLRVGRFTWDDYLDGRVSEADMRAEIELVAAQRNEPWERIGDVFVLIDRETHWIQAGFPQAFGVFETRRGGPHLIVLFGDGHVDVRPPTADGGGADELFSSRGSMHRVPPPPSGWREVLKEFLPGEKDEP